jgi:predicted nucleic acid-binding protein
VFSTRLVLQEVLQGARGTNARDSLISRFSALPLLVPERRDHIAAAELRNECRRAGIQIGTVDALLARLCVRHGLVMLSADQDFRLMAPTAGLTIWGT